MPFLHGKVDQSIQMKPYYNARRDQNRWTVGGGASDFPSSRLSVVKRNSAKIRVSFLRAEMCKDSNYPAFHLCLSVSVSVCLFIPRQKQYDMAMT